jgi:hypothetical protein
MTLFEDQPAVDANEEEVVDTSHSLSQDDEEASHRQSRSPFGFALPPNIDQDALSSHEQRKYREFLMMAEANARALRSLGPALDPPRVGGVDANGVWTGQGLLEEGMDPTSYYCLRAFQTQGTKEVTALGKIHEHCKEGMKESGLKFAMAHEKDVQPLVLCIKTFLECTVQCGLEGVYIMITKNAEPLHMLKTPARVTRPMVQAWIKDLTVNGVWDPETGKRHTVCKYDLMNLRLSGLAVMNSCSQPLKDALIREIPDPKDRTGPRVYLEIIQLVATLSIAHT